MNIVTNWFSNNDRPKDTIGRILASAPPGTIEITQTKKPKSLLTPWVTREKELKIIFRSEDSATPAPSPAAKSTRATARPLLMNTPSSSGKVSKKTRQAKSSKKPVRPAISSAPPSYETAVATKKEGVDGGGVVQASVMSGVGMAALYCAKMAWDIYSSSSGEAREEEESEEEEKEERKTLGWLGV